tara:strand:- start:591 stop:737 length:147 start_codon:yes stop_codon:yes gene_type:complete
MTPVVASEASQTSKSCKSNKQISASIITSFYKPYARQPPKNKLMRYGH